MDPNQIESPCEVCGSFTDNCVCPVCPTCHEQGNPRCYLPPSLNPCNMKLNKAQLQSRAEAEIRLLREKITDHGAYLDWLETKPDTYLERMPNE